MNTTSIINPYVPTTSNPISRQHLTSLDTASRNEMPSCCYLQEGKSDFNGNPLMEDTIQPLVHSSPDCQWSLEEQILRRNAFINGQKFEESFTRPNMYDHSCTDSRFLYDHYKYEFGSSTQHLHHSPVMGHGFSRHHNKVFSDPTLVLSLVRWARLGTSKLTGDDDQIDRLNYQITSVIFLLLIALTGMRQYLSYLPLQCWIPQEFSRSWEEYAEHFCWVTNTYFADVQAKVPQEEERRFVVRYYQWAPFVLILQAAGFILPCVIWRLLQNYSGYHVHRIMRSTSQVVCASPTSISTAINGLAKYMDTVTCRRRYKFWQKIDATFQCSQRAQSPMVPNLITVNRTVQFSGTLHHPAVLDNENEVLHSSTLLKTRSMKRCKKSPAPQPPGNNSQLKNLYNETVQSFSTTPSNPGDQQSSCFAYCCHTNEKRVKAFKSDRENVRANSSVQSCIISSAETNDKGGHTSSINPCNKPQQNAQTKGLCFCCTRQRQAIPSKGRTKKFEEKVTPHPMQNPVRNFTTQPNVRCCRTKVVLKRTGRLLWCTCKLLSTLFCLVPGCLCHWFRGSQSIKFIQRSNSFLFYLYTTVKLFYLINLFSQICFMKLFLGAESYLFGFHMLRDLLQGKAWTETGNFPRVTFCDFEAKKMGKNYRYTLQCVLPLNLFLEKVYVFLWLWLTFVALLTIYSLFKWLFRLSVPECRYKFICKFLLPWKFSDVCEQRCDYLDKHNLRMFVDQYLDRNGVLLLWLISGNAGASIAGELTAALWELFLKRIVAKPPVPVANTHCLFPDEAINIALDSSSGTEPDPRDLQMIANTRRDAWYSTLHMLPGYPARNYHTWKTKTPDMWVQTLRKGAQRYPLQVQTGHLSTTGHQPYDVNERNGSLYKHETTSSLDSIV